MKTPKVLIDSSEVTEQPHGLVRKIGMGQEIETPSGDNCHLWDGPGCTTMAIDGLTEQYQRVGLIVYCDADTKTDQDSANQCPRHGTALLHQMTADEARIVAHSLLKLAAKIDPVKH